MRAADGLLALGATLRLTRLVTKDWLGYWTVVRPARVWALRKAGYDLTFDSNGETTWAAIDTHNDVSKTVRLVSGLDCPHCVGFWLGAGVLLLLSLAAVLPKLGPLVRFALGALALNYVSGAINQRVD